MNGEAKEPVQIPVLVSFLRGVQKELRKPTGRGDLMADGLDALIDVHAGKRPAGFFEGLYDALKDMDATAFESHKTTADTIKP